MKKIRIAQIGINEYSHGRDIFNTLKALPDEYEIVGYALVENEKKKFAHILSVFDGYKELTLDKILTDPTIEAVTIETEEVHLTKYARLAAEHGKHIHMEKPGGTCFTDFEEMLNAVEKGGKTFHVGYMYRHNPAVIDLLAKIKRGELGEIICVEGSMDCRHTPQTRDWLKSFEGGMTFFLGCHLIDLTLQIQGKPQRIIPLNKCSKIDGAEGEDFGLVALEYVHGYSVLKTCALEYGGYMRRQLVVTGTKGTVQLKPIEGLADGEYYTDVRSVGETTDWYADGNTGRVAPYKRYDTMMRAFAKMARGEIQNPYTLGYEKELYKIILKCCGEGVLNHRK